MTIEVRHGRCGRLILMLRGSFDSDLADSLHALLAASDSEPERPIVIDFRSVLTVDPVALAALAGESHVPGRHLTVTGLSRRDQRLLSDFARRPWN